MLNRQVVLKSHPNGVPQPEDFELIESTVPEAGEGQMLVRNLFFFPRGRDQGMAGRQS